MLPPVSLTWSGPLLVGGRCLLLPGTPWHHHCQHALQQHQAYQMMLKRVPSKICAGSPKKHAQKEGGPCMYLFI
jgi:hypothetical protein